MAPADSLSPPGSSSYSSDTLSVGDGTWDFTKNTFLLPNLQGLNFETMRYNGMGNRFSSVTEYHSLILGHGVLAAITFLFIIPIAVLLARYYTARPGSAIRFHAYLQILAVALSTVVFALGFFAVGPPRNLTNPHHGIGVAIYVLILVQALGGRLIKKLSGRRSFRVHLHRWFGRSIVLLGIVQVPLGLTLYGSPKYTFILFAIWMAFLLFLFFFLDFKDYGRREWVMGGGGGGTTVSGVTSSRVTSSRVTSDRKPSGGMGWLGPLAAGAGAIALLRGRKDKKDRDAERALSRSPSPSTRTGTTRPATTVLSSRRSDSYYDEKPVDRRRASGGGFMNKILGAGAGVGAGMLMSKMFGKGKDNRRDDYSAVSTETPSRTRSGRRPPPPRSEFTQSEYTDYTGYTGYTESTVPPRRPSQRDGRRSPILPAPNPVAAAAALSAADERRGGPITPPRRSRTGTSKMDSTVVTSDYSSYVSPSRRASERRPSTGGGGAGKGFLAGIGLGWLANRMSGNKSKQDDREKERLRAEDERRREEEDDRRSGRRGSRYTGDGYSSPATPRREQSRRRLHRNRPPPSAVTYTETATSMLSDESSIEPRGTTPYDPAPPGSRLPPPSSVGTSVAPPPAPPVATGPPPQGYPGPPPAYPVATAGGPPAPGPPFPTSDSSGPSHPNSRNNLGDPIAMLPMPSDPQGFLRQESDSDAFSSPNRGGRRRSRIRDPQAAAAAAAATASALAAQEDEDRRRRGDPVASVRIGVRDDPDRNITLRMLTEEEARREQQRRRRQDSVSSSSGTETPTNRRYRREPSSTRRAESAAEQRVESRERDDSVPPLSTPYGAGRRPGGPPGGKDSAYYSGPPPPAGVAPLQGQPGPSGGPPTNTATVTMSSLASPGGSQATFTSGDIAAIDRRRRRRMERRAQGDTSTRGGTSVDDY